MPLLQAPAPLYELCLAQLSARLERLAVAYDFDDPRERGPADALAGRVAEDLLWHAFLRAAEKRVPRQEAGAGPWSWDWQVFMTPRIQAAPLLWDEELLYFVGERCKALRRALVVRWEQFCAAQIAAWAPPQLITLDFDGELFCRGRRAHALEPPPGACGWLPEAEALLKALQAAREKQLTPERVRLDDAASASATASSASRAPSDEGQLAELHLGTAPCTADDLRALLRRWPRLRELRHYQLCSALLAEYGPAWRRGDPLPRLRLRHIDADFSHVVRTRLGRRGGPAHRRRLLSNFDLLTWPTYCLFKEVRCRMSPAAVLPADALALAARLCPEARAARVRVDAATTHAALAPLAAATRLRALSVVCVSSGERALLNFADVAPLLEALPALTALELKVIEEVDVHEIMERCRRLERLVLSGCGHVYPHACDATRCRRLALPRLRHLFFADGDDFSWDHAPPPCFWPAVLGGAARAGERSRLEAVFLESPRLTGAALAEAVRLAEAEARAAAPLPALRVLSVCRWPELRARDVTALLGAARPGRVAPPAHLRRVRASGCERLGRREERIVRAALAACHPPQPISVRFD